MKKIKLFAGLCLMMGALSANANETYTIEYSSSSPIKSIPLKNATLVLEIYKYENPAGFRHVKTNATKNFSFHHGQDFDVIGIVGEKKYNARCSGISAKNAAKIKITCVPD